MRVRYRQLGPVLAVEFSKSTAFLGRRDANLRHFSSTLERSLLFGFACHKPIGCEEEEGRKRMKSWLREATKRTRQPGNGLPPLDYGVTLAKL